MGSPAQLFIEARREHRSVFDQLRIVQRQLELLLELWHDGRKILRLLPSQPQDDRRRVPLAQLIFKRHQTMLQERLLDRRGETASSTGAGSAGTWACTAAASDQLVSQRMHNVIRRIRIIEPR